MSFGIPVRNGLGVGLLASTFLSSLRIGGRPAMSLDFIGTNSLDSRVTFTRGTTATFVGSNGLIQTAAIDAPRFDYDPATLAPKGLLVEEARTNIFTYSQQFDDILWLKGIGYNSTVTANSTTAPDGTLTADTLVADSGGGTGSVIIARAQPIISGTSYTMTFFAKANTLSWIRFFLLSYTTPGNGGAYFNLSGNGSVGTVDAGYTAAISPFGNGWYRCSLSFTAGVSITGEMRLLLANANNDTAVARNGTSSVFIWGAQLEAGAFATSYIPTVASTVTRNADVATMTGTNFSNWYNQSEGTFVINLTPVGAPTGAANTRFLEANDGTANNRKPLLFSSGTGVAAAQYRVAGADQAFLSSAAGVFAANLNLRIATAYAVNNFGASYNGATAVTDTSGSVSNTATQLTIGYATSGGGSEIYSGHIRYIAYYNTRLPNTTLPVLSA